MRSERRFSILDGMILIGAFALAWAWVQWDIRFVERYRWTRLGGVVLAWVDERIPLAIAPLTVAVLLLRLLPPHQPRRLYFREPGFVACATASFFVSAAIFSLMLGVVQGAEFWWGLRIYRTYWMPTVGPSVLGAWLLLFASGRWRSERSWVDRLGRYLGFLWIITRFGPLIFYYWERLPRSIPPPP
jgi:hypothetical protein